MYELFRATYMVYTYIYMFLNLCILTSDMKQSSGDFDRDVDYILPSTNCAWIKLQIDIYLFNASKVGKMIRWRRKKCLIMTTSGAISKNDIGIMITTKLLATAQWRDMYVRFEQIAITITIQFLDWPNYVEKKGNRSFNTAQSWFNWIIMS